MERLLQLLLPIGDRETIVGDLYEEWREKKHAEMSAWQANIWYVHQTISFTPARLRLALTHPPALALLCTFTALCGCWLGVMDLRLRHPGYAGQTAIAAAIWSQAMLTLAALRFHKNTSFRQASMLGSLGLLFLAGKALVAMFRGAGLEGYVLLIALALLMQALLTLGTLPQVNGLPRRTS